MSVFFSNTCCRLLSTDARAINIKLLPVDVKSTKDNLPIKLEENHVHKRVIIFAMNDKALTDGILREVKVCAQEATFDLIRTHIVQGRNFRRYEFTEIRKGVNIVDYHLLGRNEQMLSMTSDERFRLELAVTKETDDSQLFVVHDQLIQPNS